MKQLEEDKSLIDQGKRSARYAKMCQSVVIADADIGGEEVRAYFVCSVSPRQRHTVHIALNGDEWFRTGGGDWRHEGSKLSNLNMEGADPE